MKKLLVFFFCLSILSHLKASNIIDIRKQIKENKKKQENRKNKKKLNKTTQTSLISMDKLILLKALIQPSYDDHVFEKIRNIIEDGRFDKNSPLNEKKETLLHLAIKNRRYHITDLLLTEEKQGTKVNLQDDKGQSALHHLLSLQNKAKVSALFSGISQSSDLEKNDLQLRKNENQKDYMKKRDQEIRQARLRVLYFDIMKHNKMSLQQKNNVFNMGENAKHTYYQRDPHFFKLNILYDLLNLGDLKADFNLKDGYGRTPLMIALNNPYLIGQDEIFRYLIKKSDVSMRDNKGNTALFYALNTGNLQAFDLIDQKQSDLNLTNYQDNNLLHESFLKLIHLKEMKGKRVPQFDQIEARKNLENLILKENFLVAKIQTRDKPKLYPYSMIAETVQKVGIQNIITYLLVKNQTDLEWKNEQGLLPIHLAAQLGEYQFLNEVVRKMIYERKNILTKDFYGKTFLEHIEIVPLRKQIKDFMSNQLYESSYTQTGLRSPRVIQLDSSKKISQKVRVRR